MHGQIDISIIQIILLVVFSIIAILDQLTTLLCLDKPIFVGLFVGIIMGDLKTGLIIGGSVQLMSLGLITAGGTTIPDYICGTTIGIVITCLTGQDSDIGISVAAGASIVFAYFDTIARYYNIHFQKRAEKHWDKNNFEAVERMNLKGTVSWALSRAVPLFIVLVVLDVWGTQIVQLVIEVLPAWVINGLKVAGKLLPVVGIAVVLRIINIKKFFPYLILGFVLSLYLNVSILGIAMIGSVMALIMFNFKSNQSIAITRSDDDE